MTNNVETICESQVLEEGQRICLQTGVRCIYLDVTNCPEYHLLQANQTLRRFQLKSAYNPEPIGMDGFIDGQRLR
jgi:hypothetical protein